MRRRHLLAGLASVGALGGAGAVATDAVPGVLGGDTSEPVEPVTLDTVDASGSRDGKVTLPAPDRPTFIDFFATWCGPCADQMPALVEAHDRLGDDVLFVSVTTQDVGDAVSEETIVDWWAEHDGDWLIGADTSLELFTRLSVDGFPSARAIDATGRVRWSTSGTHTTEEFVSGIERALDR